MHPAGPRSHLLRGFQASCPWCGGQQCPAYAFPCEWSRGAGHGTWGTWGAAEGWLMGGRCTEQERIPVAPGSSSGAQHGVPSLSVHPGRGRNPPCWEGFLQTPGKGLFHKWGEMRRLLQDTGLKSRSGTTPSSVCSATMPPPCP